MRSRQPGHARPVPRPEQIGFWLEAAFENGTLNLDQQVGVAERWRKASDAEQARQHRELSSTVDPHDLSAAGWGVIFSSVEKASVYQDLLQPLLKRRARQAGDRYRCLTRNGLRAEDFLREYDETLGTIDPAKVPYYLLLVGGPEEVSYEFQYQLSLSHAVGRVWFPKLNGYRSYALSVCAAEEHGIERSRGVTLFSVENDSGTRTIARSLVPSVQRVMVDNFPDWQLRTIRGLEATKSQLGKLLGGEETPGLLLVSTHGRNAPDEATRDLFQGSLFCMPENSDPEPEEPILFGAADVEENPAGLHGLIALLFACNSAGTPIFNSYPEVRSLGDREPPDPMQLMVSEKPFVARLPSRLLEAGALAVLGHIDRGWTTSFTWSYKTGDISTLYSLEDALAQLLRGHRIGHAIRPLQRRYAQLAARLNQMFDRRRYVGKHDKQTIGFYWVAVNDARNFVIVGDPAAYLLGCRKPQITVPLDSATLRRVEAVASGRNLSTKQWVEEAIRQRLSR